MQKYYLLLGSNVGNRAKNLADALQSIQQKAGKSHSVSSIYESEAWGMEDQPNFLNQACLVESSLQPMEFLQTLKDIEKHVGRQPGEKWGPRIIDIDILYIEDKIIADTQLKVPHPEVYSRNFALIPMIEIAGDFIDPVKQISLDEIYDLCTDTKEVFLYEAE